MKKTYGKIKFDSDDCLPQKKTLELRNIIIVLRSAFHDGNKNYVKILVRYKIYKLVE